MKDLHQGRAKSLQFREMGCGEIRETAFRRSCQLEEHAPAIGRIVSADNEARGCEPIYELYGAMVPNAELVCEVVDGHMFAALEAFDGEQRLMVLGGKAGASRRSFAERKETPQQMAKCGERLVVVEARAGGRCVVAVAACGEPVRHRSFSSLV